MGDFQTTIGDIGLGDLRMRLDGALAQLAVLEPNVIGQEVGSLAIPYQRICGDVLLLLVTIDYGEKRKAAQ